MNQPDLAASAAGPARAPAIARRARCPLWIPNVGPQHGTSRHGSQRPRLAPEHAPRRDQQGRPVSPRPTRDSRFGAGESVLPDALFAALNAAPGFVLPTHSSEDPMQMLIALGSSFGLTHVRWAAAPNPPTCPP